LPANELFLFRAGFVDVRSKTFGEPFVGRKFRTAVAELNEYLRVLPIRTVLAVLITEVSKARFARSPHSVWLKVRNSHCPYAPFPAAAIRSKTAPADSLNSGASRWNN
jgi:hypothetical protein